MTKRFFAMKSATAEEGAATALQGEDKCLREISALHRPLKVKAPADATGVLPVDGGHCLASLTKMYDGDGTILYNKTMTPEWRLHLLDEVIGLLETLVVLKKEGFYVSDIKPDNLLVDGDTLVFGDLGSAGKKKELKMSSINEFSNAFARRYTTYEDLEELDAAFDKGIDHFFEALEKKEVFSLAVTICQLFSFGALPFAFDSEKRLDSAQSNGLVFDHLETVLGTGFVDALYEMTASEPQERPDFEHSLRLLKGERKYLAESPDEFPLEAIEPYKIASDEDVITPPIENANGGYLNQD